MHMRVMGRRPMRSAIGAQNMGAKDIGWGGADELGVERSINRPVVVDRELTYPLDDHVDCYGQVD